MITISPLLAAFGQTIFMLLLGFVALFMILLILVQRGRGGGLAGALGGMGGSSAFGAKAGDVFTKITAYTAIAWIVLCIVATKMTPESTSLLNTNVAGPLSSTSGEGPSLGAPANSEDEAAADGEAASTDAAAADANVDSDADASDASANEGISASTEENTQEATE